MEAKDLALGSYAWKSILKGREVIHRGPCFCAGNGRNIKICQHHWLPIKHPTKIASPIIDFLEGATVDCLIYVDPRQWNIDMVDGIFIPEEAKLIKKIPVSNRRLGFFVLASLQ